MATSGAQTVGIVQSLHRYPVKSMLGEALAAAAVTFLSVRFIRPPDGSSVDMPA